MAYLLKFESDEREVFEALWIGFKGGDFPKYGKEVKDSITLEKELTEKSIEGGSIKTAFCPACGSRTAQHGNRRTLPDGRGLQIILDNSVFDYLKSCFTRWERVMPELKTGFAAIEDKFDSMKSMSHEEINNQLEG